MRGGAELGVLYKYMTKEINDFSYNNWKHLIDFWRWYEKNTKYYWNNSLWRIMILVVYLSIIFHIALILSLTIIHSLDAKDVFVFLSIIGLIITAAYLYDHFFVVTAKASEKYTQYYNYITQAIEKEQSTDKKIIPDELRDDFEGLQIVKDLKTMEVVCPKCHTLHEFSSEERPLKIKCQCGLNLRVEEE